MYPICCQQTRITNPTKPILAFKFKAVLNWDKIPEKISCQIYPKTMPPIKFGIKKMVRNKFVPLNFFVSAMANANAATLITITVTKANAAV